jgi:hypothetical protein
MPSNPFCDAFSSSIGNTGDYNALGAWKWGSVGLFAALLVASVAIAVRNWRETRSSAPSPISRPGSCGS